VGITPDKFFTGSDEFRATAAQVLGCSADDVAIVPSPATASRPPLGICRSRKAEYLVLAEQFPSTTIRGSGSPRERRAAENCRVAGRQRLDCGGSRFLTADVAIAALPQVQWRAAVGLISSALAKLAARLAPHSCSTSRSRSGHSPSAWATCRMACSQISPSLPATSGCSGLIPWVSLRRAQMAERIPLEENWIQRANARDFSSLILYTESYDKGARRFDMGERSNFALLPAAVRAMKQLLEWDVAEISRTAGGFSLRLAQAAAELGFPRRRAVARAHYLCLRRKEAVRRNFPKS